MNIDPGYCELPQMLGNHPTFKRGSSLRLGNVVYRAEKSHRGVVDRASNCTGKNGL